MHDKNSFVLSLGGGTPCYANNHEMLNQDNVVSIYLNASIDTLYERLISENSKRPILANKSAAEMKEFIAKHLFDRSYYYNQSKHKINVNNKSAEEIVLEIEKLLA
jgi:shikimate kinase